VPIIARIDAQAFHEGERDVVEHVLLRLDELDVASHPSHCSRTSMRDYGAVALADSSEGTLPGSQMQNDVAHPGRSTISISPWSACTARLHR
jgi:hypothetical protein